MRYLFHILQMVTIIFPSIRKICNTKSITDIKIKSKIYLGDIAISYEIVNKRSYNSSFVYELDKMWIHGYLHLSGYDHIKNLDFEKMYKKENLIFKQLNS